MKHVLRLLACSIILSPVLAQQPPKILTNKTLENYVNKINFAAPIQGPDSIRILGASLQDRTVIYRVKTGFKTTKAAAVFLENSESTKHLLCKQPAEGFLLSRGVALVWNYFDGSGGFVGSISVSPQDCK